MVRIPRRGSSGQTVAGASPRGPSPPGGHPRLRPHPGECGCSDEAIDNAIEDLIEQLDFIKERLDSKIVLLGSSDSAVDELVDRVVQKPFLPTDIEELLDSIEPTKEPQIKTNVLDPDEIARIKALMALDEEESKEPLDELDYIERLEEKESLKLKKKKAKELIYELAKLSKKEIKNLLKGAKVSIKIEYKKGDDE